MRRDGALSPPSMAAAPVMVLLPPCMTALGQRLANAYAQRWEAGTTSKAGSTAGAGGSRENSMRAPSVVVSAKACPEGDAAMLQTPTALAAKVAPSASRPGISPESPRVASPPRTPEVTSSLGDRVRGSSMRWEMVTSGRALCVPGCASSASAARAPPALGSRAVPARMSARMASSAASSSADRVEIPDSWGRLRVEAGTDHKITLPSMLQETTKWSSP